MNSIKESMWFEPEVHYSVRDVAQERKKTEVPLEAPPLQELQLAVLHTVAYLGDETIASSMTEACGNWWILVVSCIDCTCHIFIYILHILIVTLECPYSICFLGP